MSNRSSKATGTPDTEVFRKAKATAVPDVQSDAARAFGSGIGEIWKAMSGLSLPLPALSSLQQDYLTAATDLWNQTVASADPEREKGRSGLPDRRFAAQDWMANPAAAYTAQMYLLNARTLLQMAESLEGDEKTRQRIRFAVQQWVDAAAPSNFLAFNPEAQRKALETKGESITRGIAQLWQDVQQGHLSQTDESVFEVGRNVATTPGSVVFENELFQLVEYTPSTDTVFERPLLIVPPCINKFYILDLQPENSLMRYCVEQGHRTFVVSWRNPDDSLADRSWDDYVDDGVIRAIDVVRAIAGMDKKGGQINTLGFCIGGTILATTLAVLKARGRDPAASITLLTTMLDFENTGVLDLFIDEPSVQLREMTIGLQAPNGPGLLKGKELATTFSFLRSNDLVWNYVVGNYLKGETPPPFDLLYWNSDSTNLPGPMYCWYLRHTYLENNLKVPGKVTVCGEKIDLGSLDLPSYVYASREDHIVPWDAAYLNNALLKGRAGKTPRFVLGASGHIAGVINPPTKNKRSHWTGPAALPAKAERWFDKATEHSGSWWPDWSTWLQPFGGKRVPAPRTPGNRSFKPIEPAPGRYVKAKA
jgi:polyhydroxyalkanoate synthase